MRVRRGLHVLPWLARALGEDTRRRIYLVVHAAQRPLTRPEVAEAVDIRPRLAAFHLDKLAAEGLLDVHYARPADRPGGPGAGRPAKHYRPSGIQVDLTIPPRRSDLAARIMALALDQLGPDGAHRDALLEQAAACGRNLATVGPADLRSRLAEIGYAPVTGADGTVMMRNCPFHPIVQVSRDTVCTMNLALLTALTNAKAPHRYEATLEPAEGRCCVLLRPSRQRDDVREP